VVCGFLDFEYEFVRHWQITACSPKLKWLPDHFEEHTFLSSSTVREIASLGGDVSSMVPSHVEGAKNRV
jgi:pantetheine-phosphate adenylyltransferase